MNISFPSTSSYVNAWNGYFLWPNQSISQTYTGLGINSIDLMTLAFTASCNNLWSNLQWQVIINGVQVGSFIMTPVIGGYTGSLPVSQSFSFPAISSNGTYSIAMGLTAGAGNGDGYVTLGYGTASLSSV